MIEHFDTCSNRWMPSLVDTKLYSLNAFWALDFENSTVPFFVTAEASPTLTLKDTRKPSTGDLMSDGERYGLNELWKSLWH